MGVPPPNTGEGLDYVRPLETSISGASSTSPLLSYMVSGGLDRPLVGHNLGTFGTDPTQHFSPLNFALSKTNHLGTTECLLLREKIFSAHPDLSLPMASNYLAIADKRSYQDANQNLLNLHNRLVVHDLNLSASFEELEKFADEKAAYMVQLAATFNGDSKAAYTACSEYVQRYRFTPPDPIFYSGVLSSCVNRMCCHKWWKKNISTAQSRVLESVRRDLLLVNKQHSPYSSVIAKSNRSRQKAKTANYLENTYMANGHGQVFSLKQLSDVSVSNP